MLLEVVEDVSEKCKEILSLEVLYQRAVSIEFGPVLNLILKRRIDVIVKEFSDNLQRKS
jgi:predicted nucleic acid-binding Zn ribbon protein